MRRGSKRPVWLAQAARRSSATGRCGRFSKRLSIRVTRAPHLPVIRAGGLAHRLFLGLARSLVVDESQADDLVQDAWVAAIRFPPSARTARGWFRKVLRTKAARAREEALDRRAVSVSGSVPGERGEAGTIPGVRRPFTKRSHAHETGFERAATVQRPARGPRQPSIAKGSPSRSTSGSRCVSISPYCTVEPPKAAEARLPTQRKGIHTPSTSR
ncbi:MAG: hypothetical protein GY711_15000 [bacterium]|nr:hypothetical protein [bacterium]